MGEEETPTEKGEKREYVVGNCKPPIEHRFKPGQIPNPGGRPKKALITDQIIRLLKQKNPKTGKPYAQAVAEGLIKELAKGKNAKELLDRIEGPVTQAVDVNITDDRLRAEIAELERQLKDKPGG